MYHKHILGLVGEKRTKEVEEVEEVEEGSVGGEQQHQQHPPPVGLQSVTKATRWPDDR